MALFPKVWRQICNLAKTMLWKRAFLSTYSVWILSHVSFQENIYLITCMICSIFPIPTSKPNLSRYPCRCIYNCSTNHLRSFWVMPHDAFSKKSIPIYLSKYLGKFHQTSQMLFVRLVKKSKTSRINPKQ